MDEKSGVCMIMALLMWHGYGHRSFSAPIDLSCVPAWSLGLHLSMGGILAGSVGDLHCMEKFWSLHI